MTILDASMSLFEYFQKNDSFELNKNFKDIVPVTDRPEEDKAAVQCSLEDMEKFGVIAHSESNGTIYYVLKKSLDANEQEVNITPMTALGVAKAINGFCHIIQDNRDECNPFEIIEKDIQNLVFICGFLASNHDSTDEEQKE